MEYSMDIPVGTYSANNYRPYRRSTSLNIKMYATLFLTYKMGKQQMSVKLISVFWLWYSGMRHHVV